MKRTISLILTLCLLLSALTGCAGAELSAKTEVKTNSGKTLTVDDTAGETEEETAEEAVEEATEAEEPEEAVEEEEPEEEPVEIPEGAADRYIDLHLHLDGAITPEIAVTLAELQDIELPAEGDELAALLQVSADCADLNEFLECFALPCSLIQTPEGLEEAVCLVLDNAYEQGVVYAELRFAPSKCCDEGMTQRDAIEAALKGLKRSKLKANLILCCMRGEGNEEENKETVELCAEYLVEDGGVVALDLAGAEALYPTENYRELFAEAAELGIPFTIHAGEASGAESVALAVEYGAKRIGHGVNSFEDPELLKTLKEEGITLEMCPTSNRQTHAVEDMSEYPLRTYMEQGISVTLNTDDPAIENTTLGAEYRYMEELLGLTPAMEKRLLCNAVNAAFTSEEVKAELREELGLPYETPEEEEEDDDAIYTTPYVEGAGEKNKIILDTDLYFGNDDAATLFLTLYEEQQGNCKIMGITTVGGNCTVAESTCATLRTLELLGRTDIMVFMGQDEPYGGYRNMEEDGEAYGKSEWYGAYWDFSKNSFRDMKTLNRNYLSLSSEPSYGYPEKARAASGEAVNFIINTIHEYPGEVTLFIMGSGANVAEALSRDPSIAEDAAGVVYMGGALDVSGNSTSAAEFNWWYDPAGMQKCLEAGWKSSILIPNDIAEKVVYTQEIYDSIAAKQEESAPASIIAQADYARFYGDDSTPPYVWDALIALAYFHPEWITELEERYVACETTPGYNYGRTVSWWTSRNRDVETGEGMPENAVRTAILTGIDEEAFWDYYVKGNSW